MTQTVIIEFENSIAESNVLVQQLVAIAEISKLDPAYKIEPKDPSNQDAGTILTIVLGAPSIVILAQGLRDFLKSRSKAEITIKKGDGTIVAKGITSRTAEKLLKTVEDQFK